VWLSLFTDQCCWMGPESHAMGRLWHRMYCLV